MGTAAVVIGVVTALVGAGSAIHQAGQASDARDDQAKLLEEQAERDAAIQLANTEKLTAKQRALYAASGVRVDVGSPLAVIAATERKAAEERAEILKGYGRRADALRTDADRIQTGGYASGTGTLLGGAADFAESPYAQNLFKT